MHVFGRSVGHLLFFFFFAPPFAIVFLYIPYLVLVLSLGRKGRQAEEKSAIESNNSLLISYFLFFLFLFLLGREGAGL